MLDFLFSYITGNGAISTELDYITSRMDEILKAMLSNSVYQTLQQTFGMIGILLMTVYFLIDLMEKVSDMQFDMEMFFKQFLKYVIAYGLMTHIPELCNGLAEFSFLMTDAVLAVFNPSSGWADMVGNINSSLAGFSGSGNYIDTTDGGSLIGALVAIGFQIILQFGTWKLSIERALKIGYKTILAPIICADMVTNGYNSSGIKHLKSIFALYLQTVVVLLALICINEICVTNGAGIGIWSGIVALFLLKDTIKGSRQIAEEIVG